MKYLIGLLTENFISLCGTVLTVISATLILSLIALELFGFHGGPYTGILVYLIFPGVFAGGLVLIPLGHWWQHRRERKLLAQGKILEHRLPVIDLNRERTRIVVVLVVFATVINIAIISASIYKGMEVMDSTAFCGKTCHTVMAPEFTTYQRSPHSRVKCVECHIGEGASWFVKSKLSGAWQLVAVAFNLYSKPIPTPVHNLRPARETCEQCHWPTKFVGDKLKVITHYAEDEQSTEKKTVMMIRIGGSQTVGSHGIHWHVDPNNTVRFLTDEKRETIGDVELTTQDGKTTVFKAEGDGAKLVAGKDATWRTMDCVDCHNRPTHIYRSAVTEVESALASGRIDKNLPFIRREAVKALDQDYPDNATAKVKITESMMAFYKNQLPHMTPEQEKAVATAADELAKAFSLNVFPQMGIKWGTYKSNIGHNDTLGCFRCHDDQHKAPDGKTISMDCSTCHKLLANDEKDPEIIKQLGAPVFPTPVGN